MIAAISTKIKFYRINMKIKSSDSGLTKEAVLNALAKGWSEMLPSELVRQRAERLLSIHPLRAADAFQLAAALIWAEEAPQGLKVVCLDQNLQEGAFKEGFTVLP